MKYHLLMTSPDRRRSFILNSYRNIHDALQGQRWMFNFETNGRYVVTVFNPSLNAFVTEHDTYQPVQGPYTDEAWQRICNEIGYEP